MNNHFLQLWHLCDVITLNPQNLLFHIATSFLLPPYHTQTQPVQVYVAFYFSFIKMNQPLKAINVIKNPPAGAAMARVLCSVCDMLQLVLDCWDLLE